jgi:hypothetical protein
MRDDESTVGRSLRSLAEEPIETDHLHRTMLRVRTQMGRKNPMKNIVRGGLIAGTLVTAAVAGLVLFPATYSVRVGSIVQARFKAPVGTPIEQVVKAAPAFTNSKKMLKLDQSGSAELSIACKETDTDDLVAAMRSGLLAKYPGLEGLEVSVEPIVEERGGNALAAMTGGRIEIGVRGLSDREIEASIAKALTAHGMHVREVSVSTTEPAEGQIERRVEIRADCDTVQCQELELMLDDGMGDGPHVQREKVIIQEDGSR